MSTPDPLDVLAERPAERALFRALFDDAAVFPPGLTPLPQAVTDHVARQWSSYADLVGPLLVPASAIKELLLLTHPRLEVALVGRPGADLTLVSTALEALDESDSVTVSGIEIGWSRGWHRVGLGSRDRAGPVRSIEVPRDIGLAVALSDIAGHAGDASPVQAKFRTGSTPGQPAPTARELATFIRACVDHDLSFKLTGGLHRAISSRGDQGVGHTAGESAGGSAGERVGRLGFLNVIAATRWALAHGAEIPAMEALLTQGDPVPIVDIVTRMSEADASVVRAFFTSYGCCGVLDPIGDLVALGLIRETTV